MGWAARLIWSSADNTVGDGPHPLFKLPNRFVCCSCTDHCRRPEAGLILRLRMRCRGRVTEIIEFSCRLWDSKIAFLFTRVRASIVGIRSVSSTWAGLGWGWPARSEAPPTTEGKMRNTTMQARPPSPCTRAGSRMTRAWLWSHASPPLPLPVSIALLPFSSRTARIQYRVVEGIAKSASFGRPLQL